MVWYEKHHSSDKKVVCMFEELITSFWYSRLQSLEIKYLCHNIKFEKKKLDAFLNFTHISYLKYN